MATAVDRDTQFQREASRNSHAVCGVVTLNDHLITQTTQSSAFCIHFMFS